MNLDDCAVFVEPYFDAAYFGPNRNRLRYANQPIDLEKTYEKATESICKQSEGKKQIFCKDMAFYLEGNLSELENENLKDFQHTFLIRHPKETIPSYYRAVWDADNPLWKDDFDPNECSFRQLYEIYQLLRSTSNDSPLVVDSTDLVKNPERVLKYYCDYTGLMYKEGMSFWEPGPFIMGPSGQESFVSAVHNSSGLGKIHQNCSEGSYVYPDIVEETIKDNEWFYEQLSQHRLRL